MVEQTDLAKYVASIPSKELRTVIMDLMIMTAQQQEEINNLKTQVQRSNASYMSNCRSSGGVTLTPGM